MRLSLGALAAGALSGFTLPAGKRTKLVVLHTNDMHSRIDPFPADHPKYPDLGGMARRAAAIKAIREQEEHVLLLDAGDIFQGTPYFNIYGGELEFKLMSQMGYDAATMGNHDFDNGLEGFAKMLPEANFPFVCSNYDFSDTILNGKTVPYKVLKKGGLSIGIIGLGVELEGLVDSRSFGKTRYLDPVKMANKYAAELKTTHRCDLVICLSHLGYQYNSNKISDLTMAPQTEHIDLIIGGHTHSFLEKPVSLKNLAGKKVIINQVGWAGVNLGRIDFIFRGGKSPETHAHSAIQLGKNYS